MDGALGLRFCPKQYAFLTWCRVLIVIMEKIGKACVIQRKYDSNGQKQHFIMKLIVWGTSGKRENQDFCASLHRKHVLKIHAESEDFEEMDLFWKMAWNGQNTTIESDTTIHSPSSIHKEGTSILVCLCNAIWCSVSIHTMDRPRSKNLKFGDEFHGFWNLDHFGFKIIYSTRSLDSYWINKAYRSRINQPKYRFHFLTKKYKGQT